MNTPTAIIPFALLGLVLLTGCPSSRPSDNNDDAAGETGSECSPTHLEHVKAERDRLRAELAECKATAPK